MNERDQEKRGQSEARTGIAAVGGKIVVAGDTRERPGRADNRTSLEGGTTITQKSSLSSPLMGCERENLKQRDQGRLRVEGAWVWTLEKDDLAPKQIGRTGRTPRLG